MSCAVGPAGVFVLRLRFTRRDLGEARRDDLAPWRVGRSIGKQRLQGGLGRGVIAALQRRFGAVEAGARVVAGFGKLCLRRRCHGTPGGEHEDLTQLGMQLRLIGLKGNRATVSLTRFVKALQ